MEPHNVVESQVELNGISQESYSLAKHVWNTGTGNTQTDLKFFNLCVSLWLYFRPFQLRAEQFGWNNLFERPHNYFRDMVIVGAQTELERIRGYHHSSPEEALELVRYIRWWRIVASADYVSQEIVEDTAEDYVLVNRDANAEN